jgi:hypothetical protein
MVATALCQLGGKTSTVGPLCPSAMLQDTEMHENGQVDVQFRARLETQQTSRPVGIQSWPPCHAAIHMRYRIYWPPSTSGYLLYYLGNKQRGPKKRGSAKTAPSHQKVGVQALTATLDTLLPHMFGRTGISPCWAFFGISSLYRKARC